MSKRTIVHIALPVVVGAVALAGCGSQSEEGGDGDGPTVKIAMIAPLSGDLAALGLGMRNSSDLAIKQANEKETTKCTLEFVPEDDTADAATGAQAASKVASDAQMVGVIGTLNSSVAQQVQPILAQKNIVMVSPANTTPALTQGEKYLTAKKRQSDSYFRVATTDAIQGPFGADFLLSKGYKTAVTVNDQLAYGVGLTQNFAREFTAKGGKIVGAYKVSKGDKDFGPVVSRIKQNNPSVIYYGGQYPEASLLSKQSKAAGLKAPLMGGDGLVDKTYIAVAGASGEGDFATNVGAPTDKIASAAQYVKDYEAAGYKDDFSAYGAYTYDATNVVINAIAKVVPDDCKITDDVRKAVIAEVQATDTTGATGEISFDEYGDTTNRVLTVYVIKGGAFSPLETREFQG